MRIDLQSIPPTAAEIADERDRLEAKKAVLVARRRGVVVVLFGCAAVLLLGPLATLLMGWTISGADVVLGVLVIAIGWTASLIVADAYDEVIEAVSASLVSLGVNEHWDCGRAQKYAAALGNATVAAYASQIAAEGRLPVIAEVDEAIAWAEGARERQATRRTFERIGLDVGEGEQPLLTTRDRLRRRPCAWGSTAPCGCTWSQACGW